MSEEKVKLALVPQRESAGLARASVSVNITGLAEVFQYARALAHLGVGVVPKAYAGNENAIAACIVTGAEMGIGAMESLRSIYIVDGKPQLAADLMMRIAIQRGVTIEWHMLSDTLAHARFTRPGFPSHEHKWSIEDAQRAGLATKDVWKKYPRAMLRARCVSEALRAWAPDVLGAGVYVEGEIADESQAPEPVQATVTQAPTAATRAEPKTIGGVPKALPKITTREMFAQWCEQWGSAAAADPKNAVHVETAARRLGIDVAEALTAAGFIGATKPVDYDPDAGEVPPDQEPPVG